MIGVWVYASRPVLVGITNRLTYAQRFALAPVPFVAGTDLELLATLDPTKYANGYYKLRLSVTGAGATKSCISDNR